MKPGFVYVLSNPSMPGVVKVGYTTRSPVLRAVELYTPATSVPEPFELEFAAWSPDSDLAEKQIHMDLDRYRISAGREFFKVSVERAICVVINNTAGHKHAVTASPTEMCIDEGFLCECISKTRAGPEEICAAIENMSVDMVRRLIDEYREWKRSLRERFYDAPSLDEDDQA